MIRLARLLALTSVALVGWSATPARAGFTITTMFNSGQSSLAVPPSSGASGSSLTLGSATTNVADNTSGMMSLNLATQTATPPAAGASNFSSTPTITVVITQTGTTQSGTITVDDMLGGSIGPNGTPNVDSFSFNETLQTHPSSPSLSVVVNGTTFTLQFPAGTPENFNMDGPNNAPLSLGFLTASLMVTPGPATVPEPASAWLAALGVAGVALATGARGLGRARARAGHAGRPAA